MKKEQLEFLMFITGHDEETIMQIYNDWIKFNPK